MITRSIQEELSKGYGETIETITQRLQDFSDEQIKKTIKKKRPKNLHELCQKLLELTTDKNIESHLLGFDNAEHMETCYKQFEKVQQELREGIK